MYYTLTMKLFNSYSQSVEEFQTLEEKQVRMYICGITPYDTTHLGHAFVYVQFDALKRFLEFKGYKVTYTQNVTDIDDDILKRAKRDGKDWIELGDSWTEKFLADLKALNVQMPDHYIKATSAIDEIVEMVSGLIEKGFAYESQGNVSFEVSKFSEYGKLSKYPEQKMLELLKERGGNPDDHNKRAPLDFILWQKSAEGEPSWDSPWGKGRPGWHIECSAMIKKTLGEQIDIHGGGFDLIYPHHESEIAQSQSFTGLSPFVKYWMHIAMVSYQGEKMSKSLGNLVLVADLLKKYSANAVRLMLLLNHYRKPWEFTDRHIEEAQELMNKLEQRFNNVGADTLGLDDLIQDMEKDFNLQDAINKLVEVSENEPERAKSGFELLGFRL